MFVEHKEVGEPQEVNPLDEAGKLLLKAADLIEKRGLCKNTLSTDDMFCVNGAILHESGWFADYQITAAADEAIRRLVIGADLRLRDPREQWGETAKWNNRPERTKEEVVAKLRAVALGT